MKSRSSATKNACRQNKSKTLPSRGASCCVSQKSLTEFAPPQRRESPSHKRATPFCVNQMFSQISRPISRQPTSFAPGCIMSPQR